MRTVVFIDLIESVDDGLVLAEKIHLQYKEEIDLIVSTARERQSPEEIIQLKKLVPHLKKIKQGTRIFYISMKSDYLVIKDKITDIDFDDVLFIDFYLYRVWTQIIVMKKSMVRSVFSSNITLQNKFLYLNWKLERVNRIRLFKKIVDCGLIDHATYSLGYPDDSNLEKIQCHVPEMTHEEVDQFIKNWNHSPDDYLISSRELNAIPYDIKLFSRTDFSLISETEFVNKQNHIPFISEKTWMAIINQHPFIIAAEVGHLKQLEEMGFYTFTENLPFSDYDSIEDTEDRLNAIVANTRYFLENDLAKTYRLQAQKNYNVLKEHYETNLNKLLQFKAKNKIEVESLEQILPTHGRYEHQLNFKQSDYEFYLFYNGVKDPSWPECKRESDFHDLPEHIKKECIETFGYTPTSETSNINC